MDNSAESLDVLANIINELSEKPYDIALHAKHIKFSQTLDGMESEVQTAMEMLPEFLAAGEDVWLYLLEKREESVDLNTATGVNDLLALYNRAEADYLSIPILKRHLQFLLDHHSEYHSGEDMRPTELGEIFTTEWTREAIADVVNKGVDHLTQSHLLWDQQRDWEMDVLEAATDSDRDALVQHVQQLLLTRLRQPHANFEDTFQSYSTFTTNYKPPAQYESLLIAASKVRGKGERAFERRANLEGLLTQSSYSLDAYAHYVTVERRAKYPDILIISTTYERAIAEAAKRRFNGEEGAEQALRVFWIGYCDALRILNAERDAQLTVLKRATRSIPGSGEIWARYIRLLERLESFDIGEDIENVEDIFNRAFDTKLIQQDVDQIVAITLSRAGYERRRLEAGNHQNDTLTTLIGILESGIQFVYTASKTGDAKLRLERNLIDVYERANLIDSAIGVWQSATKINKSSYLVWTAYIETLMRHQMYDQVRAVFEDIHKKQLDWPELIWELWMSFEHLHGSVDQVDDCLDKIEKAQAQVHSRRAKEAEKASYQAIQAALEVETATAIITDAVASVAAPVEGQMEVDVQSERGTKRAAEEDIKQSTQKKTKIEQPQAPLKRDRENCTVFVSDLPRGVTENDLAGLFNDCGTIREIKITQLSEVSVATVEFSERDSVPAALTKDKKRMDGQEVAVHLAWKSTLYVTNFPESYDDAAIRQLFGKYGTIFDVRWPSKKLKSSRRFCYIQYTSPDAAQNALELHGRELKANHPLNVFISNPERKKTRTDQDADERELYVAGLSKFTVEADLEKIFTTYGNIKDVRLAKDQTGQAKGFAFIEFEQEQDARAALAANNYELKKRYIAVTMANSNIRSRHRNETPQSGLSRTADIRSRSIRVRNLPPGTQEGLLQQILEKIVSVKRVEVFLDKQEAVVELSGAAEAGRLLLSNKPIEYEGNVLQLSEEPEEERIFVPRRAGPTRPKAGLGHARKALLGKEGSEANPTTFVRAGAQGRGQDDFRKMLGGPPFIVISMSTDSVSDHQEITCITFEWTLRGLKNLFDSTKGEHKSKVTKSPLFGGGRWQVLFYANSGLPKDGGAEGNYVSLYLACEPTTEEKDAAIADSGRWVREGVYKFCFELRNASKTVTYNTKEAQNHSFSWKNANWGWAQFTRRDTIYYQSQATKSQDALLIICTITSSPYVPAPLPIVPRRSVPKSLIDTIGNLLDDPTYSDVEFIIPRHSNSVRNAKTIWASRKMLQRVEYFDAMLSSNFAEGTSTGSATTVLTTSHDMTNKGFTDYFEDSDQDDEDFENSDSTMDEDDAESSTQDPFSTYLNNPTNHDGCLMQETSSADDNSLAESVMLTPSNRTSQITEFVAKDSNPQESPKLRVIVRDAAYATYRAVLYYLYTDFIMFSPLSSSFAPLDLASPPASSTNVSVAVDAQGSSAPVKKSGHVVPPATSRKEWIKEWCQANPGKPTPCSAKAVYRLADRLELLDLKDRAAQHIFRSLTVDNIAYEVFSPFSATYDEIRKVLVDHFLTHWHDVRNSESMKIVWKQIRNGRHPGFEEVWPVIVQNLEFKPSIANGNGISPDDPLRIL
ncbi:hypothetical protein APHAL10511_002553 [Amanita phalloides]|nr:hypothetical protein APHAL10511_002553 [Amanita phalloides]